MIICVASRIWRMASWLWRVVSWLWRVAIWLWRVASWLWHLANYKTLNGMKLKFIERKYLCSIQPAFIINFLLKSMNKMVAFSERTFLQSFISQGVHLFWKIFSAEVENYILQISSWSCVNSYLGFIICSSYNDSKFIFSFLHWLFTRL